MIFWHLSALARYCWVIAADEHLHISLCDPVFIVSGLVSPAIAVITFFALILSIAGNANCFQNFRPRSFVTKRKRPTFQTFAFGCLYSCGHESLLIYVLSVGRPSSLYTLVQFQIVAQTSPPSPLHLTVQLFAFYHDVVLKHVFQNDVMIVKCFFPFEKMCSILEAFPNPESFDGLFFAAPVVFQCCSLLMKFCRSKQKYAET